MKEILRVGKIVNTHGLKGEVKVIPLTDDPKRYNELEFVLIDGVRRNIEGCKYQKDRVIVKVEGINSIEEAEKKYEFQRAYCDTCAALDETKEAEDYNTAITRVMNELKQICKENSQEGGNILVVAHGGIIRLIIDYLDKSFNIRNIDNSSISMISYRDGEFKVESVNDNSYSEKGEEISKQNL